MHPRSQEISTEIKIYCGMEQLVARWAHNPKVVGSSPAPATKKPVLSRLFYFRLILIYIVPFGNYHFYLKQV